MTDLRQRKRDLRQIMKDRRAQAQIENPDAPAALRDCVLKQIPFPPRSIVGSYSAIGSEINPAPLAEALRAMGYIIALPVVAGEGRPLLFRRHEPGDPMELSVTGIAEPASSAPAVEPDILLVPMLAFDRRRHRLGYGGGYYDRTIEHLRRRKPLVTIGLAFACQEIPGIPTGAHDVRLDKIATEIQAFQD